MAKVTTPYLALRIYGAENARGSIIQWRESTKERIFKTLADTAPQAVEMMREQMRAAYPEGGKTANSLGVRIGERPAGPVVSITVNEYRELKYMTRLIPGSNYRANEYPIVAKNADNLLFFWRKRQKWVLTPRVMHPGFPQGDILAESGEEALRMMGLAVENAVRSAVADVFVGGAAQSVSGRRFRG